MDETLITPAETSATVATETAAAPVPAAAPAATATPAKRAVRTREQKLLDESKALFAALSTHTQYVDDQNLLATLSSSIAAEEQSAVSSAAKVAKVTEIKNVRQEANATIAAIRAEANAKIMQLDKELDALKAGDDKTYKDLLKIYNNLFYGAKRIILSNDDAADDAITKLLK